MIQKHIKIEHEVDQNSLEQHIATDVIRTKGRKNSSKNQTKSSASQLSSDELLSERSSNHRSILNKVSVEHVKSTHQPPKQISSKKRGKVEVLPVPIAPLSPVEETSSVCLPESSRSSSAYVENCEYAPLHVAAEEIVAASSQSISPNFSNIRKAERDACSPKALVTNSNAYMASIDTMLTTVESAGATFVE